jgi:hypothetical protein
MFIRGDEPVTIKAAVAFGLENKGRFLEELKALLRILLSLQILSMSEMCGERLSL